jgi:hypothetical protein
MPYNNMQVNPAEMNSMYNNGNMGGFQQNLGKYI